jgi:5-methylcytosine-specific restriction protein B
MTLLAALCSRSAAEFGERRDAALTTVAGVFPAEHWGVALHLDGYTDGNYANLWTNELRRSVRLALEDAGKGLADYAAWLGEVHYTSVAIFPKRLFPAAYQSNAGWRILGMGFPAVGVVAIGLASHYQNAQNHNRLGTASNLLFDHAQQLLAEKERQPLPGRKVKSDDWDHAGLLPQPVSEVAGVDLTDAGGLELGDVRTTTVKKILASLISVVAIECAAEDAEGRLAEALQQLRDAASYLAGIEEPA